MNPVICGNQNATILANHLKNNLDNCKLLDKIEEQELIQTYKNDREKLNELLCMHNIQLVYNMAKKYMSKTLSFDDLLQDGLLGLAEAATRYDIESNNKFCTYAFFWIKKYMTMNFYGKEVELDKRSSSINSPAFIASVQSNSNNEVTLENYINDSLEPTINLPKTVTDEINNIEQSELCADLLKNLKNDTSLSATDKAMFIDMFYNKEKPKQLAEKYDMTVKEIAKVKMNILSKFKDILQNMYNIGSFSELF